MLPQPFTPIAYYATTHAALSYYTEAPKYYTTKAAEYYTTNFLLPQLAIWRFLNDRAEISI
jgi:hypothetical protein